MEVIKGTFTFALSAPTRKRSATMFDKQDNSFLPLLAPTHSGSQTPVYSQGSAVLSRKNSHRLPRKPALLFLSLTPELPAITSPDQYSPSHSSSYNPSAPIQSPVDAPAPRSVGRSSFRTRSNTGVSFKSVDFVLAIEEKLRVDTTINDYDPDPVFHRAAMSPTGEAPVEEAFVEQVGSFDVGVLRKDSLGNLPKISHSPIVCGSEDGQSDDGEDDKTIKASPSREATPREEVGLSPVTSTEAFPVCHCDTAQCELCTKSARHDGAADSTSPLPVDL